MQVIGLTGVARSGKDTVGKMIEQALADRGQDVIVTGFAHKLKLSAYRCFAPGADLAEALEWADWIKTEGSIMTFADDTGYGEGGPTVSGREFLQHYGTEAHRDVFGEGFWLDAVLPPGRDDCDYLVITDVRFENEAERIHDRGGEIWQVVRPGVEAINAHASDAGVPASLVDVVVENAGSLAELRFQVEGLLL